MNLLLRTADFLNYCRSYVYLGAPLGCRNGQSSATNCCDDVSFASILDKERRNTRSHVDQGKALTFVTLSLSLSLSTLLHPRKRGLASARALNIKDRVQRHFLHSESVDYTHVFAVFRSRGKCIYLRNSASLNRAAYPLGCLARISVISDSIFGIPGLRSVDGNNPANVKPSKSRIDAKREANIAVRLAPPRLAPIARVSQRKRRSKTRASLRRNVQVSIIECVRRQFAANDPRR